MSHPVPRRLGVIGIVALFAATQAPAQIRYRPGDVIIGAVDVISQQNSILGITPQGALYTLVPQIPFLVNAITNAPDNRGLLAGGRGSPGGPGLARIAPDGTVSHISIGSSVDIFGLDVDGSGNVIVSQHSTNSSFSVLKLTRGIPTTLYTTQQIPCCYGAGIDLRSGNLVYTGVYPSQYNLAVLRATLRGPPSVSVLHTFGYRAYPGWYAFPRHDPDTDTFLLTRSQGFIERFSLRSPGPLTTLIHGRPLGGWVMFPGRDPADGSLVIPTFDLITPAPPSRVLRLDAMHATLRTVTTLATHYPSSATVAGRRHLCGLNEVWPGQMYAMLVSSPAEPGAAYVAALAFDYYPGFRLPDGRKVHLTPDPLFYWSLTNAGPFSGFRGTLDSRGEAVATVAIPSRPALSGVRFFASAITLINHRISVISDPLGVTIQ